jgi:hypothetical protein
LPGTEVDQYLPDLTDQSEEPLLSSLKSLDRKKEKITSPGDLLIYLINNTDKVKYPEESVYKAIANLIIAKDITSDDIAARFAPEKNSWLWIILILLGSGLFIIFFIFRKRRKGNEK